MRNINKALAVILALLALAGVIAGCRGAESTTAAGPKTRAFIWEVTSNTTSVYLMGSIHVARQDIYPLDDTIEDAFDAADYLVVELNPEETNVLYTSLLVAKYGSYPEGESLKDSISKGLYESYKYKVGDSSRYLEQYRPWVYLISRPQIFLASTDTEYEIEYGIDIYFIEKAAKKHKEIIELETIEYQITQLSSIPDEAVVRSVLADADESSEAELDALFDAWLEGNTMELRKLLFSLLQKDPKIGPMYEKLYFERNLKMAEKIEEFLAGSDVYFIVVGAAHLVGERGLVNLMEQSGYRVEQLYNSD